MRRLPSGIAALRCETARAGLRWVFKTPEMGANADALAASIASATMVLIIVVAAAQKASTRISHAAADVRPRQRPPPSLPRTRNPDRIGNGRNAATAKRARDAQRMAPESDPPSNPHAERAESGPAPARRRRQPDTIPRSKPCLPRNSTSRSCNPQNGGRSNPLRSAAEQLNKNCWSF